MIKEITQLQDVSIFFHDLFSEGVNAHPDEDFTQYINCKTEEPTYTAHEAGLRNTLMKKSFIICEMNNIDIYSFMQKIYLKETGLDKFIPRPSQITII